MKPQSTLVNVLAIAWLSAATTGYADSWSQFRGPNGSGISSSSEPLPAEIGPDSHLLWKTAIPSGHSSPVVVQDRVYLTAVRGESPTELLTICLERQTGEILWEAAAPYSDLELVNPSVGGLAQSTCAANTEYVVSFFGSAGLLCYDRAGNLVWRKEFKPFKNDDGAGSSPILVGDRVILCQDHDQDSFLTAIRVNDGSTIWETARPEFIRGYATPVIWENAGRRQIVIAGSLMVKGYDFETGQEAWLARGLSWGVVATPVIGDAGQLFVASLAGGIMDVQGRAPTFEEVDVNHDGVLIQQEFIDGEALAGYFTHFDRDKNGEVVRAEFDALVRFWDESREVVMAIRPGGSGDITDTHIAWTSTRLVPWVPTPLFHAGTIYVVKDNGVVGWLDAETGETGRRRRLSGRGDYYSSPVLGDGKIYFLSQRGDLSVVTAERQWREVASASFDEETFATPAIADGRIYLRTAAHLYCCGYETPAEHDTYVEQERQKRANNSRWLVIAVATGLVCLGGITGGFVWRRRNCVVPDEDGTET